MDKYLVPVYGTYIVCAVGLTVWLARTLFHNGAVFLHDVFEDRQDLADSVNHLLVTGFFMINLGYALILMRSGTADTGAEAFRLLVTKLGVLLFSLAVIHFVNMAVFWKLRQRRQQRDLPPPVAPQRRVVPPPPAPDAGRRDPRPAPPVPAHAVAGASDYPDPEPWVQ
jgi:hypothetical protein